MVFVLKIKQLNPIVNRFSNGKLSFSSFFILKTKQVNYDQRLLNQQMKIITTISEAKEGQISDPNNYFINNRLYAFHIGLSGYLQDWKFISKLSYSRNFGTYKTSSIGGSLGEIRYPPLYGTFIAVNQFSGK